jgi:hypothetical protein
LIAKKPLYVYRKKPLRFRSLHSHSQRALISFSGAVGFWLCHNRAGMETATTQPAFATNEATLIDIVDRAMHASSPGWLFFRELRVGTGRRNGGAQRLDAFALNTQPHTAIQAHLLSGEDLA